MSLMDDVIHQVNHPPTCTSIYHSQGALKVFLLAGLLICGIWHIAGYVTKLIAKFQVANSSPEIAKYHYASHFSS